MSLATKRIHISRDVVFHEDVFPFVMSSENCSFPSVLKSIRSTNSFDYTEPYYSLLNKQ